MRRPEGIRREGIPGPETAGRQKRDDNGRRGTTAEGGRQQKGDGKAVRGNRETPAKMLALMR